MMKIGMRTIKTAIAVSLTIFIAQLINLKNPLFAGIAAIIAMQSSVVGSFKAGKNRMLGTVFGAVIGLFCSLISPNNPIVIGLGIMVVIYLLNLLEWQKSASIAAIVFLSITLNQQTGNRLSYSIYRTLDTFVGIIIATFVNFFILPPKYENKVESSCNDILARSMSLIKGLIWENKKIENEELENIRINLETLENYYDTLKEEVELKICKSKDCRHLKDTYISFRNIYENLNIISNIDFDTIINRRNKQLLESIYNKKTPYSDRNAMVETDIIFNYHLKIILEEIESLMDILN
ncbi:FUSC family protein [Anaerosalibacter massiliensis]|uniref:Aromatic acid exporter family protein n=1 Tax=Anaerosalibacter massiliensis TaxID=1347392 RepID=A0A9X2MJQ4_9FIRM|nr:aromatic acid exporter family protein [Anaerosalibacter massiliensis]MCR2044768.1 aromatic acid exporter family protein [Anaerosalibacter massiliensis]